MGRVRFPGLREEKEKEDGERLGWAGKGERGKMGVGWAERRLGEGEVSFFFNKRFKQFNSNLNSREFKFELNNKK